MSTERQPAHERQRAAREAFRLDTLKAWEEFKATGLHVTQEEAEAWLASLGTEHELPVPTPHT